MGNSGEIVSSRHSLRPETNTELQRPYFHALDHVLVEMESCFSEHNNMLVTALKGLDSEGERFLDAMAKKPIVDLTNSAVIEWQRKTVHPKN